MILGPAGDVDAAQNDSQQKKQKNRTANQAKFLAADREDKIRMELYRIILALYGEGYRTFSCNLNTYIGLLAADTAIMLREADKCPDIHLSVITTGTSCPAETDKVYCALYDDCLLYTSPSPRD
mgnify:CR=1 FL=1